MERNTDVLIVGAGHAGAQAAIALRQFGFEGGILLAGEEPEAPYERPPLSKDYLAGEKPAERLLLRPLDFWSARRIELLPGTRIATIDAQGHRATTQSGAQIAYRRLIWAAGGRPRPLPLEGADFAGVHMLRTKADSDAIRAGLAEADRIVVIGGGYIGLEAAAVFASLGKSVTLLEAQPRVLARVADEPVSRFFEALHRAHGVDVRTGVGISAILGEKDRARGVLLGGGATVPADLVLVGIGIIPNQAVMSEAGAACRDGVIVDQFCRTSLPDVYAIGDCAAHANAFAAGEQVRIESVQNAVDQARTAAAAIAGRPEPYAALPWFWSNQYDVRLQTAGLMAGHDRTVIRGDPGQKRFSLGYFRQDRLIAIDCINAVGDFAAGKLLIAQGARLDAALFADPAVKLKSLLPDQPERGPQ